MSDATEIAVDDALRTGILASAKANLKEACKELEHEIRKKNEQITLLQHDINRLTKQRDSVVEQEEEIRASVIKLREEKELRIKELDDYRARQIAAIEKAQAESERKAKLATESQEKLMQREQAAQTSEWSYISKINKVREARESIRNSFIKALDEQLEKVFPSP